MTETRDELVERFERFYANRGYVEGSLGWPMQPPFPDKPEHRYYTAYVEAYNVSKQARDEYLGEQQ